LFRGTAQGRPGRDVFLSGCRGTLLFFANGEAGNKPPGYYTHSMELTSENAYRRTRQLSGRGSSIRLDAFDKLK
jgi:hypothetical protein